MVASKPRVVIIGAGMAGLTAAHKLHTTTTSQFELTVVEGGARIGGRINTTQFGGDRVEMGATWIHGIGGSPVHKIAEEINGLESDIPWECMDGFLDDPVTIAENGFRLSPEIVDSVSLVFKKLMDFAQGKLGVDETQWVKLGAKACEMCRNGEISVGGFLKKGFEAYWEGFGDGEKLGFGELGRRRRRVEEAIFAMHENTQRTYTSAGDLFELDFSAESEYEMFPGEEITIARGYMSVINYLVAVLPPGVVELGRRVVKIEWKKDGKEGDGEGPVRIEFSDGSVMYADHVIVTVSLGVLKDGVFGKVGMFDPPLPVRKVEAIRRLGYGTVNKLFLQVDSGQGNEDEMKFPFLQMAFHQEDSKLKDEGIPWWMRKTTSLSPIYKKSSVLLGWFAGDEALALEKLDDEEILSGVSATASSFLHSHTDATEVKFNKVLRSKWGGDPLFLGSYSYVAVGSSGDDLDKMAEPLPEISDKQFPPQLQILFAGEATHRTHYSTTHGAYFSGIREANRLLKHYNFV